MSQFTKKVVAEKVVAELYDIRLYLILFDLAYKQKAPRQNRRA